MQSQRTLKRLAGLSALLLSLCLTACGPEHVRFVPPPPERTEQVPAPAIPPATTPCVADPGKLCNSDEETGGVIAAYDAALAEANRRLAWLRAFFTKPK